MRRVTVEVASVGAHPRLCAGIAIHGDAGGEPNALEFSRAQVAIEEVRVRVVGDEQIDEPVVVIVGCNDTEAVRARAVGQAVSVGRFLEPALAEIFEEEVGFAGQSGRSNHDARPVAPDERALGADDSIPGRLDIARDVQVEVAVGVGVEERAAGTPPAGGDPGRARRCPRTCRRRGCGRGRSAPSSSRKDRGDRRRHSLRRRHRCPTPRHPRPPASRRLRTSIRQGCDRARSDAAMRSRLAVSSAAVTR